MNPVDAKEFARLDTELHKARAELAQLKADAEKFTVIIEKLSPLPVDRSAAWQVVVREAWEAGVKDAIKVVKARQAHYELYRGGLGMVESMTTHPATFATLAEILVFLEAMLSRGEYKVTSDQL